MGYIIGVLFGLLVLIPVFMLVMFLQFGTTPKEVIELYKMLKGLQLSNDHKPDTNFIVFNCR
jgi:hypothetical protein